MFIKGNYMPSLLAAKIFLRSFFVQSSWNFDRMQNLGFSFIVFPALKEKYACRPGEFRKAQLRHLEFFNTHPYFAALVAGMVAKEEGGEADQGTFLTDLKRSLTCTLGSLGDEFFWATLRPFAALAALVPALFEGWWAPLIFLVLFNLPHFYLRWWGVSAGLKWGRAVIGPLQILFLSKRVPPLSLAIAGLAGLCAGIVSRHSGWALVPGETVVSFLAGLAVFGLFVLLSSRRLSLERILLGLSALAILGGALREVVG